MCMLILPHCWFIVSVACISVATGNDVCVFRPALASFVLDLICILPLDLMHFARVDPWADKAIHSLVVLWSTALMCHSMSLHRLVHKECPWGGHSLFSRPCKGSRYNGEVPGEDIPPHSRLHPHTFEHHTDSFPPLLIQCFGCMHICCYEDRCICISSSSCIFCVGSYLYFVHWILCISPVSIHELTRLYTV